jgi:hypothetical protein
VDEHAAATVLSWDEYVDAVASPMVVYDRHLDVVAANPLAGAVSAAFRVGTNLARFTILNPMVEETTDAWRVEAARVAALLREALTRHDADPRYRGLVGELVARSPSFAELWADPDAVPQRRGTSVFRNPLVGVLHLAHEHLRRADPDEHTILLWAPVDATTAERLEELRSMLPRPTA